MKSYDQAKREYIDHFGRPKKRGKIVFIVTFICMLITIVFSFWNMRRMQNASSEYVKDYVSDITYQMAETGLDNYIQSYLDNVSKSVSTSVQSCR